MSYEKQNFEDGQTLTAEQLNHIEDGIVDSGSSNEPELLMRATFNPELLTDYSDIFIPNDGEDVVTLELYGIRDKSITNENVSMARNAYLKLTGEIKFNASDVDESGRANALLFSGYYDGEHKKDGITVESIIASKRKLIYATVDCQYDEVIVQGISGYNFESGLLLSLNNEFLELYSFASAQFEYQDLVLYNGYYNVNRLVIRNI